MRLIRILITLLLALAAVLPAAGQGAPRKRVGLVLGGGGAKGAAEVGVLKVLEEAGIPIDYIAGTSIGSIVGGLYAIGYTAADLDSLFRTQDWSFLLSDQVKREATPFQSREESELYLIQVPLTDLKNVALPSGYQNGQNLVNLFSRLTVGYHEPRDFSTLPVPFRCVAVDLVTGKERVLSSGSLPEAMRASMSIPGVFTPVDSADAMFVDGGALNNFPVDVVRDMGADVVIGVDLSSGLLDREDLNSVGGVVRQLINIMGREKYERNKTLTDVYINPKLKGYYSMSFQPEAIDSMLALGEAAARDKWDELMALRRYVYGPAEADSVAPARPVRDRSGRYFVRHVRFEGISPDGTERLRRRLGLADSTYVTADEIERCVTALRGLDIFSKVEYRLTNSAPYDLVFLLEADGNWQLNVGARFDTRDIASILVNVTSGKRLTSSNHLSLTGRISKNAYLQADYSYGSLLGSKLGASYQLKYNDFDLYSNKKRVESMTFLSHRLSLFYTATLFNFSARAGARVDYFDYHHSLYDVNYTPLRRSSDFFLNYFVDFTLDTYDSKYFPTKGARTYISGTVHTDNGVSYDGNEPFVDAAFHFSTVCRLSDRLCLQPALKGRFVFGDNIPSIYQNYVGGNFDACYMAQQVAWESVQHVHIVDHDFMAAKLALRYRLKERIYLAALAEYGKESHHLKSIFAGNDLWGVALQAAYDFMLGPVALQVNYSNLYKNVGVYASAGFWF